MAGIYRAQVVLRHRSNLPANDVVNTWHFLTDPDTNEADYPGRIRDVLRDFYTVPVGAFTDSVASFISPSISRTTPSEINITRRPGAFHFPTEKDPNREIWGSPQNSYDLVLPAPRTTNGLPSEVAAVLSYRSSYGDRQEAGPGSTRPRARRRGRLFIGPLVLDAVATNAAGATTLQLGVNVIAAAQRLLDAGSGATDHVHWATYSVVEHAAHRVVSGFMDNAPDTQRRRGEEAVSRQTFGAA